MATGLTEFERGLRDLIGKPTKARPFVCAGNPLAATIFLVGYNPATTMDADFWWFWNASTGFDKTAWFETYKRERAAQPLKPGKSFRPAVSPTRRNIETFVKSASPAVVLETNIFAVASATKPELALDDQDTAPFHYLLRSIRPKVIVAHGKEAAQVVARLDTGAHVISVKHLSRGWSAQAITQLGAGAAAAS